MSNTVLHPIVTLPYLTRSRYLSIFKPSSDEEIADYGGVRVHVDVGAVESDGDIEFDGVAFERVPEDPVAAQSSPPGVQYVAYIVSYTRRIVSEQLQKFPLR